MPCMGPDLDYARQQARAITGDVLALLWEKHRMGSGSLDKPNGRHYFRDELKIKLLEVIEEISVDDACAGF